MRVVKAAAPASDPATDEIVQRRFKKAMALKESIGLSASERHEIAMMIPGLPDGFSGSWKELNSSQLHDLITMMEGYAFISYLLLQRESKQTKS